MQTKTVGSKGIQEGTVVSISLKHSRHKGIVVQPARRWHIPFRRRTGIRCWWVKIPRLDDLLVRRYEYAMKVV